MIYKNFNYFFAKCCKNSKINQSIYRDLIVLIIILLSFIFFLIFSDPFFIDFFDAITIKESYKNETLIALWTISTSYLDEMLPSLYSFIQHHYRRHPLKIYLVSNEESILQQTNKIEFLQSPTVQIFFEFYNTSNFPTSQSEYPYKEICALRILWAETHPEISRYIYADGDVIFRADIDYIYFTDFGDNFAVVGKDDRFDHKDIGTSQFTPYYFNSGVLVLNADMIRKENKR